MRQFARSAVAAAVAVGFAVLRCGPAPAAGPGTPRVLTVATLSSVDSLSPFLAQRQLPSTLHRYMYDFLTNYDPVDDHPVPGLAQSWSASPDRLSWTFTLRPSTWSDGR